MRLPTRAAVVALLLLATFAVSSISATHAPKAHALNPTKAAHHALKHAPAAARAHATHHTAAAAHHAAAVEVELVDVTTEVVSDDSEDTLSSRGEVLVSVSGATSPVVPSKVGIGASLGLTFYDNCYTNDWSESFNNYGTSWGSDSAFITSLYRSGFSTVAAAAGQIDGIHQLESVQSCTIQGVTVPSSGITTADWWYSFGRTGWSLCQNGLYLMGMSRNVRHTVDLLTYIENGKCAAPDSVFTPGWDVCYTQDVTDAFDLAGWVSCKADYFVVGFWRYTVQYLHGIEKLRCCKPKMHTLSWTVGEWGVCTGTQARTVVCSNEDGVVVADSYCATSVTKPDTTQTCVLPDTYIWISGVWSDASTTCGTLHYSRTVGCYIVGSGVEVGAALCTAADLPVSIMTEESNITCDCPGTWTHTTWSSCSATCGNGTQTRTATCGCSTGCLDDEPTLIQVCNTDDCPAIYGWAYTSYGDCSVTCGAGTATRVATCRDENGVAADDETLCTDSVDVTIEDCTGTAGSTCPCASTVSAWTSCSASCGTGVETRTVTCDCDSCYDSPVTQAICSTLSCPVYTYEWVYASFSDCSATCGTAYKTRTATCYRTETTYGDVIVVDGTSCDAAGVFTSTLELECSGLADCPVSLPWQYGSWSDCSTSCGAGIITRTVWCPTPALNCTGTEPISTSTCHTAVADQCVSWSWSVSSYGDCSLTCGEADSGTKVRDVACVSQWGTEGTDAECVAYGAGTMPAVTATCTPDSTCYYPWIAGSYTSCDVDCGWGVQTRTVTCSGPTTASCTGTEPVTTIACNTGIVCPTYTWVAGEYTDCDVSCLGAIGVATRIVACYDDSGVLAASSLCTDSEPATQEVCSGASVCTRTATVPVVGEWSACSTTCGAGVKIRDITCWQGTIAVDISLCDITLLATSETCTEGVCACTGPFDWVYGEYSDCSASCGEGYQTRTVICKDANANLVSSTLCNSTEPSTQSVCTGTAGACATPAWSIGSWGDCTVTCGDGTTTRSVSCLLEGTVVSEELCLPYGSRPISTDSCIDEICPIIYSWLTTSWSDCSAECVSGVETRTATCIVASTGLSTDTANCVTYLGAGATPVVEQSCTVYSVERCTWQVGSWSTCEASCDVPSAVITRTISCASGIYCDGDVPVSSSTCSYSGDCTTYAWSYGAYSDCSESCGITGIRTRTVTCLASTGDAVAATYCTGTAGVSMETCVADDPSLCEDWVAGSWSDCSVTCGTGGIQVRTVTCPAVSGQCKGTQPDAEVDCSADCGYHYAITSWSTCSETCGKTGVQTRTATCVDALSVVTDASDCGEEVIVSSQSCSSISDDCPAWLASSWTDCSATCGSGTQSRIVSCDSGECIGSAPVSIQDCADLLPCPVYLWYAASWTDCTVTCGTGTSSRYVECRADGTAVDSVLCLTNLGDAPIATDSCIGVAGATCPNVYKWQLGEWSDCDATCGAGNQTRSVTCIDEDTLLPVADALCLAVNADGTASAPLAIDCCFAADCVAWRVSTWGLCINSVQTRSVRCIGTEDLTEYEPAVCVAAGAGSAPVTFESC